MTASRLGISNTPSPEIIKNMELVAYQCFEPLRAWYGKPIGISSFYRCPELNKAVGGSKNSQHMTGQAIDIDADIFNNGITNREIYLWIIRNLDFDQLIWEYGDEENPAWVHVSYNSKTRNRHQIIRIP